MESSRKLGAHCTWIVQRDRIDDAWHRRSGELNRGCCQRRTSGVGGYQEVLLKDVVVIAHAVRSGIESR